MNEQAIKDSYELFKSGGYSKSIDEFKSLIASNPQALNDSYELFKSGGYSKDLDSYKILMGLTAQPVAAQPVAAQPDKKKVATALPSAASSLESVSTRPTEPTIATRKPQTTSFGTYGISKPQPPTAAFTKPVAPEPTSILGPVEKDMSVKRDISVNPNPTPPVAPKTTEASDYFTKSLDIINEDLMDSEESMVVPKLNYTFGQYGFKFSETTPMMDEVKVISPNGKEEVFSLDNWFSSTSSEEAKRFKKFISDNRPTSKLLEAREGQFTKPILSEEQAKENILKINTDTDLLNKEADEFIKLKNELDSRLKNIESLTPEQKAALMQSANALEMKRLDLARKSNDIQSRSDMLNQELGSYAKMKSEQGTPIGALWNSVFVNGIGGAFSGLLRTLGTAQSFGNPAMEAALKASIKRGDFEKPRELLQATIGAESTSKEYIDSAKEGSFLGAAVLGVAESLPAMLAGPASLPALMAQGADAVYQEMDKSPDAQDMPEWKKALYATTIGAVAGYLENLGFSNAIGQKGLLNGIAAKFFARGATNVSGKSFKEFVNQEVKSLVAKGILRTTAGGLAEAETGILQEIADVGLKEVFNAIEGDKTFKTPESAGQFALQVLEAGASEAVGGIIMSSVGAVSKGYQENKFENLLDEQVSLLHQISSDPTFIDSYKLKIKEAIAEGKMTTEEGEKQKDSFDKMIGQLRSIPKDISPAGQKEALRLLKERDSLQAKIDISDPDLVTKEKARVAEIKEKLNKISEDYAVQKPSTEESVLRNEEPQVGLQEMGEGDTEVQAPAEEVAKEEVTAEPLEQKSSRLLDAIGKARELGADGVDALNSALANLRGIAAERINQIGNRIDDLQQKMRNITKASTIPSATMADLNGKQVNYNGEQATVRISEGGAVSLETPTQVVDLENVTPTTLAADAKVEVIAPAIEFNPDTDRYVDNDNVVINNVEYGINTNAEGNVVGLALKDGSNQVITNEELLKKAEVIRNTEGNVATAPQTMVSPAVQSDIDALNKEIAALEAERSAIEQETAELVTAEVTPTATEKRFAGNVLAATRVAAEDLGKLVAILTKANKNVKVVTDKAKMVAFLVKKGLSPEQANQVKGVRVGDTVYINPELATVDTPIHEFAHIWGELCKKQRPELWKRGLSLITKSNYYKDLLAKIKADPNMSKLYPTPEAIKEEALIQAIGERGAVIFDDNKLQLLWNNWVAAFDNFVKKLLGLPITADITKIKLSEFLDMAATEVLTGKGTGVGGEMTIEKTKAAKDFDFQIGDWNKKLTTSFVSPIGKIFDMSPELSKIGTLEQYSRYLESIYPKSLVQGILFHSTFGANKFPAFEKFKKGIGIYFSSTSEYAKQLKNVDGKGIVYALVDIRKPFETTKPIFDTPLEFYKGENDETFSPRALLDSKKYDSVVGVDAGQKDGNTIVVFNEDNVHILGSQKDLDGFKKYVSAPTKKSLFQSISDYLKSSKDAIKGAVQFQAQQSANDLAKIVNDAIKAKLTKAQIVDILVKRGGLTSAEASQVYNDVKGKQPVSIATTGATPAATTTTVKPKTKFVDGISDAIEQMAGGNLAPEVKDAITEALNKGREAVRLAQITEREMKKQLVDMLKDLVRKGTFTQKEILPMMRRIAGLNAFSSIAVDNFVNFMVNKFETSEAKAKDREVRSKVKNARKNLKSKVGVAKDAMPTLRRLFSLNPRIIPPSVRDAYNELVIEFGERAAVLSLDNINDVMVKADNILQAAINEQNQALLLKNAFDSFQNKVLDANGNVDYAKTIKQMIDDGVITTDEADIMARQKKLIFESVSRKKTEAEIEAERVANIDTARNMSTDPSDIQTRDERNDAEEFIELINTDAVNNLTPSQAAMLPLILDNINNGWFPTAGKALIASMNGVDSGKQLADVIMNKAKAGYIKKALSSVRAMFRKETSAIIEFTRGKTLQYIDAALGINASRPIYNLVLKPIAESYSVYKASYDTIERRIDKARDNVLKSFRRNGNKLVESSYKQMAYMLQREYLSNKGMKGVVPVVEIIDATIQKLKKDNRYADAQTLEQIKNDYVVNGEFDNDKLYNSFNAAEKKCIDVLSEINEELTDKAVYTASVIRGDASPMYLNYIHHDVLVDANNPMQNYNSVTSAHNPSTKAASLIARTGGVKPLNFDAFSAVKRSSRNVLLDYNMTQTMRTVNKTLSTMSDKVNSDPNVTKDQEQIAAAIEKNAKEVVEDVFMGAYNESTLMDDTINYITKSGYRSMLAGVRSAAELITNFGAAMYNPKDFFKGVGIIRTSTDFNPVDVMMNVKSSEIQRLYSSDPLTGKYVDPSSNTKAGAKSEGKTNKVFNKINQIRDYTTRPLRNKFESLADVLISAPDKAVMRPHWFGTFASEFKKVTGVEPDFEKIAANDEAYMKQYKDAINKSRDRADKMSVFIGASDNPFKGILKNTIRDSDAGYIKTYKRFNAFMTRFLVFEYATARAAVYSLVGRGELSKSEGAALLGAITLRMIGYQFLYSILSEQFQSLIIQAFGGEEPKEDDKDLEEKLTQSTLSAFANLVGGRDLGNTSKSIINYGIEQFNEAYLEDLRDGREYDKYKDNLVYSPIPLEMGKEGEGKKYGLDDVIISLSGPLAPIMKTAQKGLDLLGQEKRKDRYSRERQKRNIEERIPLEVLGHLGFIPFYKDLRGALIKDINRTIDYKEPKGLTKDEMKKYMPDLYEQVYGWQEELKKDSEGINSAEEDAKKRREEILKNMFGK